MPYVRAIPSELISDAVCRLFTSANRDLPDDVECAVRCALRDEGESGPARDILGDMLVNARIARDRSLPICQDTGMAVVFCDLGQDVHIEGALLGDAVDEGVRRAYLDGKLRCSVVADPLRRANTGDNTPAVLHVRVVPGDKIRLLCAPKGFGSENMSAIKMFNPTASQEEIMAFVAATVAAGGSNPCPPVVVGVGLGGNFEQCALLAKRALTRPLDQHNADPFYAEMERELLERINALDIGPQGFGGRTTALGVAIETAPTHIAGLPVAVNMGCHVNRHAEMVI